MIAILISINVVVACKKFIYEYIAYLKQIICSAWSTAIAVTASPAI